MRNSRLGLKCLGEVVVEGMAGCEFGYGSGRVFGGFEEFAEVPEFLLGFFCFLPDGVVLRCWITGIIAHIYNPLSSLQVLPFLFVYQVFAQTKPSKRFIGKLFVLVNWLVMMKID